MVNKNLYKPNSQYPANPYIQGMQQATQVSPGGGMGGVGNMTPFATNPNAMGGGMGRPLPPGVQPMQPGRTRDFGTPVPGQRMTRPGYPGMNQMPGMGMYPNQGIRGGWQGGMGMPNMGQFSNRGFQGGMGIGMYPNMRNFRPNINQTQMDGGMGMYPGMQVGMGGNQGMGMYPNRGMQGNMGNMGGWYGDFMRQPNYGMGMM